MSEQMLMNVNEAADYLRVSRASIYRLFKSGDMPCSKVAGRVLVRREDMDKLVIASVKKA